MRITFVFVAALFALVSAKKTVTFKPRTEKESQR
jgi:hypothetical protein